MASRSPEARSIPRSDVGRPLGAGAELANRRNVTGRARVAGGARRSVGGDDLESAAPPSHTEISLDSIRDRGPVSPPPTLPGRSQTVRAVV
ncbi:unnamed protein product [Pieris brassicae]|uniref:Uncharacterized protein n=1 Tax=Pieris brassicae TaxID=7116 RepID=A0A9P0THM1_PIEBR|nr:unnamed protein product [Pieris brassicae]